MIAGKKTSELLIAVSSFGESLRQALLTVLAEACFNAQTVLYSLEKGFYS